MKVVINRCFGGFGVSREAAEWMAARGNKIAADEIADHDAELAAFEQYKKTGKSPDRWRSSGFDINIKYGTTPRFYGHMSEIERHDADLVAAVEHLGKAANGEYSSLAVVEIPDGTSYEVSEYDGNERIAEQHRTWS